MALLKKTYRNRLLWTTCYLYPVALVLFISISGTVQAQGNLMVLPKRVVFDGTKKFAEVNLANTGNDTATYMISVVNMRRNDDGNCEFITQPDSGQNFADKYIRIFPRRITLWANKTQVVKVQLAKGSQLPPGEYCSHIYFRSVPDEKPLGEPDKAKEKAGISVELKAVFGITIPVIIRVGPSDTRVNISDVTVAKEGDIRMLKMHINRTGNMSVYGELIANYISPEGKVTQVGYAKGITVATPNHLRRFEVTLKEGKGIDYSTGKIHLKFNNYEEGKSDLLAETEISLNK